MGAGTAIAGFFGMNLVSGLEEHPHAFAYATWSGLGLMAGEFPFSALSLLVPLLTPIR